MSDDTYTKAWDAAEAMRNLSERDRALAIMEAGDKVIDLCDLACRHNLGDPRETPRG